VTQVQYKGGCPLDLDEAFQAETHEGIANGDYSLSTGIIFDSMFSILTESQKLRILTSLGWTEVPDPPAPLYPEDHEPFTTRDELERK
jgi:hypothetical protein